MRPKDPHKTQIKALGQFYQDHSDQKFDGGRFLVRSSLVGEQTLILVRGPFPTSAPLRHWDPYLYPLFKNRTDLAVGECQRPLFKIWTGSAVRESMYPSSKIQTDLAARRSLHPLQTFWPI